MRINFIGPDPNEFISGGNRYNRHLIEALEMLGSNVEISSSASNDADLHIFDSIVFDEIGEDDIPHRSVSLLHHLPSLHPGPSERFNATEKPLLKRFEHHIVTSKYMYDWMVMQGFEAKELTVLEPVCSLKRSEDRQPSAKLRAIMLNNVVPRKGVLPFLQGLSEINIEPVYHITVVGDLDLDEAYSRECQELVRHDKNLSKTIAFTGSQDEASVRRIISKSNLFISAAFFETFGMSIQEASILGLPLLVRRGGNACNHVLEGVNGFCADHDRGLAQFVDKLAHDQELFRQIQTSALTYQHPYATSWRSHAQTLLNLI